jgi:hypothetical protein
VYASACVVVAMTPSTGLGQQQSNSEIGTLSILFENDIFYHSDRDYTNGVQIAWTSAPADVPDALVDFARAIPSSMDPAKSDHVMPSARTSTRRPICPWSIPH